MRHIAGDAVGAVEIDRLKQIGFQISAHLLKGGAIQERAGIAVVSVYNHAKS